jgi:hypothetical protein
MVAALSERVSLAVVAAVLGHADPKTTARYPHVDTASPACDPRLHLTFPAPSGKVFPLEPDHQCTRDAHDAGDRMRDMARQ